MKTLKRPGIGKTSNVKKKKKPKTITFHEEFQSSEYPMSWASKDYMD